MMNFCIKTDNMSIRKVICEYIYLDITKNHHYYDEVGYYYLGDEFIIQTFLYSFQIFSS